jgi:hypothetical protein
MDGEAPGCPGAEYCPGEPSVAEAARKHGLTVAEIEDC